MGRKALKYRNLKGLRYFFTRNLDKGDWAWKAVESGKIGSVGNG